TQLSTNLFFLIPSLALSPGSLYYDVDNYIFEDIGLNIISVKMKFRDYVTEKLDLKYNKQNNSEKYIF
ncbi:MAG: hypothetical protein OXI08_01940, partial [Cyanobacteria bacterium MAG IRC4_bin_6]|nr:hypothetical protein [Cyanobacteria bacterium MAG IRC3_bin_20]MDE0646824.1 hypothetical protein [Cyanobacteria bacterium MAG IRC4_bin_6]